jgi:Transposase
MSTLIDSVSQGVPKAWSEVVMLGQTLKKHAADVLAYSGRPGTSNGPAEAINGRLEHLRGSPPGFRNPASYIVRSLPGTGGFRPELHPALGYAAEGGDARDQLRASDPAAVDAGEARQLTLNLNPGGNCSSFAAELFARLLFKLSSFRSAVAAHGLRR